MKILSAISGSILLIHASHAVHAEDINVANAAEFRAAMARVKPDTRLLLEGGSYGGNFHFTDVGGEEGKPIIIAAADPRNRPQFSNADTAIHFSNPAYVELHDLTLSQLNHNGLNIDDGSKGISESARGIVIHGLHITDVGSDGNHDAIKLSGIWDFRVSDCTVERWGTKGGSGIDMVGCHRGLIEDNTFRQGSPDPPNSNGIQGKGGSTDIVIRGNLFDHPGGRAVNLGGSTGLEFFRPALVEGEDHAEARNLRVEGNTFIGSLAPIGFVGVDGATVRFNTIKHPGRWCLRILQENQTTDFIACRNGEFTDNTILFNSTHWSEGGVNIGGGTSPQTFKFERNWWYCEDNRERSRPRLPVDEIEGVYGRDLSEAEGIAGADALPK